ncbi:Protein RTM1 [Colletotrichum sp. SAR 10_70]|nr:Protein RTM1 [Colletotrichum sp. SAR 10_71]KAI8197000.1 Protein RTM1 [Colletotrichum sp. SAR 10_70]
MVLGGICDTFGHLGRAWAGSAPLSPKPFMLQLMLILVAPVFISATLYITLGRLKEHLLGHPRRKCSPTSIFILADIVAFCTQIGGSLVQVIANPKIMEIGGHVVLGGLLFQLFVLVVYFALVVRFQRATQREVIYVEHWRRECIIPALHNLRVDDEDREQLRAQHSTVVFPNCVVTSRLFLEALADFIDLWRVPVHPAEYGAFRDARDHRGARMAMRRGEAVGRIFDLNSNDGFPGIHNDADEKAKKFDSAVTIKSLRHFLSPINIPQHNMKAIQVLGPASSPEIVATTSLPTPIPNSSEILIRVHAAGITAPELFWPELYTAPHRIPGHELSGTVAALGPTYPGPLCLNQPVFAFIAADRGGGGQADFGYAAAQRVCV